MEERTVGNMLRILHPYYLRDLAYTTLFENFPVFVLGIGIVAGGFVASWIVYRLMIFFGLPKDAQAHFRLVHDVNGKKRLETYDKNGGVKWKDIEAQTEADVVKPRPSNISKAAHYRPLFYSARTSVVHFSALVVKYSIIVFGFYIAFGIAGVNVFSLAFSLGAFGLIGAYSFNSVLSNTAGTFVMTGTGTFVENMVISIRGHKGSIKQISALFTTVACEDSKTGKKYLANVPNKYFNDEIVLRFPDEEPGMEDFEVDKIESEPPPSSTTTTAFNRRTQTPSSSLGRSHYIKEK